MDEDFDIGWILQTDRFKNFHRGSQKPTLTRSKTDEIDDYRRQERERYKIPHLPFVYNLLDGRKAVVGPVFRKKAQVSSKPRDHMFLKPERPPGVNILAVVRDAAA